MKSSLPRTLQRSLCRLNSTAPAAPPGPACSPSYGIPSPNAHHLPPVRYHFFREPLPYPVGLKLQADIIDRRLARRDSGKGKSKAGMQDVLLLLEHVPTYTTGRRDNSPNPDTLHPEEKKVQNVGADFFITKRGGQVTYHGSGQLVGYPIFDLNAMELSTRCYVEYMQRLLGEYCSQGLGLPGIDAPHKEGHVGVFAGEGEKVASIGIHLRHRITSHGFAINVTPEPKAWFDLVTACGLADMRAVSIHDLLQRQRQGAPAPSVEAAAVAIKERFANAYGREMLALHGGGEASEEVEELRELVRNAEEEAGRLNEEKGGWRSEPDRMKDIP